MKRRSYMACATVLLIGGMVRPGLAAPNEIDINTATDSAKDPARGAEFVRERANRSLSGAALEVVRVDIHDRLYPDRWPKPAEPGAISVPRGAPVSLQFAVRSETDGVAKLTVTGDLPGKVRVHWLKSVHVEGNTQGSLCNRPGGKVPAGWLEHHLVRAAPFDTLEAVIEGDTMSMIPGRTHGAVIEIPVPRDTHPGTYKGEFRISMGDVKATVPFAFHVHSTVLPDPMPLHSIHWLWAQPVNLTNGKVPEWWSVRYWQLLEQAGKQLRRFGDDTVFTPLTGADNGELIQITRRKDGTYAFDYSRFDRWCELFLGLGFRTISGRHIVNMGAGTYVTDEATGKREKLLKDPKSKDEWLAFLPTFYDSLYAHLKEKGWADKYMQCQYDEPRDEKLYRKLAGLARKHLPGIPTCDAINNRADRFSPLVDTQVFSLLQLNKFQKLAAQRNANGQAVWLYHCTSPYPPHPNRAIDNPLTESRLYPWLCYKLGANGFLFWAANGYRGADEYKTSLGPFAPGRKADPGHPPGDNWFYYRTPTGLQPSLRIFSHREGLIDYALLTLLAQRRRGTAGRLVAEIAPSISTFEREPAAYHKARTAILDALDDLDKPVVKRANRYRLDGSFVSDEGGTAARKVGNPGFSSDVKRDGTHALHLDGVQDLLSLPAELDRDFTIAFWAKYEAQTRGGSVWRPLLYAGSDIDRGAILVSTQRTGAGDPSQLYMGIDSRQAFDVGFDDGKWHFLALTLSGNTWTAYHDGERLGQGVAKTHTSDGTSFQIGGDPSGHKIKRNFKGYIDDIRTYNYALTGSDMAALYEAYK